MPKIRPCQRERSFGLAGGQVLKAAEIDMKAKACSSGQAGLRLSLDWTSREGRPPNSPGSWHGHRKDSPRAGQPQTRLGAFGSWAQLNQPDR